MASGRRCWVSSSRPAHPTPAGRTPRQHPPPTDAVHVVLERLGQVHVDDVADALDVQPARRHVRGHQHLDVALGEVAQRSLALRLALGAQTQGRGYASSGARYEGEVGRSHRRPRQSNPADRTSPLFVPHAPTLPRLAMWRPNPRQPPAPTLCSPWLQRRTLAATRPSWPPPGAPRPLKSKPPLRRL